MDFDGVWWLLALPVAFLLGWLASRFDLKQLRRESRESPKAYFKGLNLLLSEQHDKAIDAFIEAVQNDPETAELHFALGSLFRRRGEFERAVRVHRHLLGRSDLPRTERDRAQHALAQDFMKAGLFDHAEDAYRALLGSAFDTDAQLALLALHERSHDWRSASESATALERLGTGSFALRRSHHWCELAREAEERGQSEEVDSALRHAREAAPQAPRPLLMLAERAARRGDLSEAMRRFEELRQRDPSVFGMAAEQIAAFALGTPDEAHARKVLDQAYAAMPGIDLLRALATLDRSAAPTHERLAERLRQAPTPSLAEAALKAGEARFASAEVERGVIEAVAAAARPLQRYRCAACGFESHRYFWQCPGCLTWDSFPPRRIEEL